MTIQLYGIPNCDTVKKARAWLADHAVAYDFHDFKKLGVPAAQLDRWIAELGWEKLINRQGTTWRKLDPSVQASVTGASSAKAVMTQNVSTIRRPIVEWEDGVTVGFSAEDWATRVRRLHG